MTSNAATTEREAKIVKPELGINKKLANLKFNQIFDNKDIEDAEKVEILRLLENRVIVRTVEVPKYGSAVDTPEDLERVRSEF